MGGGPSCVERSRSVRVFSLKLRYHDLTESCFRLPSISFGIASKHLHGHRYPFTFDNTSGREVAVEKIPFR